MQNCQETQCWWNETLFAVIGFVNHLECNSMWFVFSWIFKIFLFYLVEHAKHYVSYFFFGLSNHDLVSSGLTHLIMDEWNIRTEILRIPLWVLRIFLFHIILLRFNYLMIDLLFHHLRRCYLKSSFLLKLFVIGFKLLFLQLFFSAQFF